MLALMMVGCGMSAEEEAAKAEKAENMPVANFNVASSSFANGRADSNRSCMASIHSCPD